MSNKFLIDPDIIPGLTIFIKPDPKIDNLVITYYDPSNPSCNIRGDVVLVEV